MKPSHTIRQVFDDPNLVSTAGLVPALRLAESAGLYELLEALTVPSSNAAVKTTSMLAGIVAGTDSIDDLDLLRHGVTGRLFAGVISHFETQPRSSIPTRCGTRKSNAGSATPRSPRSHSWRSSTQGAEHVACRLVVRRVRRLQPSAGDGSEQGELFATYRHHAFITNSTLPAVAADRHHRDHAIVEQVIAELKAGPLAHLPSGKYAANAAWVAHAVIAFNLARACAVAADLPKARWASQPAYCQPCAPGSSTCLPVSPPPDTARSPPARPLAIDAAWQSLWVAAIGPPAPAATLTTEPPPGATEEPEDVEEPAPGRRLRHAHPHIATPRPRNQPTRICIGGSGLRRCCAPFPGRQYHQPSRLGKRPGIRSFSRAECSAENRRVSVIEATGRELSRHSGSTRGQISWNAGMSIHLGVPFQRRGALYGGDTGQ